MNSASANRLQLTLAYRKHTALPKAVDQSWSLTGLMRTTDRMTSSRDASMVTSFRSCTLLDWRRATSLHPGPKSGTQG